MINLDKLDPEQVIAFEGFEYKLSNGKSGPQINIKECPSCHSTDWKLYLNAETGLGKCHRCDTGFNKYKLVKANRGITNHKDVMRALEDMSGLVSYRPKTIVPRRQMNVDWNLPQNYKIELEEQVPQYLKDRNVNAKLCQRFDLRFCEYGFYSYKDFADKDKAVDFSQRIIIPIKDADGNLVTFQGRDITGSSSKKYLFPNMLPGTGRFIYNINNALKAKAKVVVLNEGCFDVFATTDALESDLKYKDFAACGTFGKHLSMGLENFTSEDQLSDLFRLSEEGVEEFVVLWDGELDAIKAATQTVVKLNECGLFATLAVLGGGLDPAETEASVLLDAIDNRSKPSVLDIVRMKISNE